MEKELGLGWAAENRLGGTDHRTPRRGEARSVVILRLYLWSPGDPTDSMHLSPAPPLTVLRGSFQCRALGPRGERREGEAAAAGEPDGLVGSDRLGWKTFSFYFSSPER